MNNTVINVPSGKLASEDAASKLRKKLAKDLSDGKPVEISTSGSVTGETGEQKNLKISPGKLASQWYQREPQRLEAEKAAMKNFFPEFTLNTMDDGRYYWHGTLNPGIIPDGWAWEVAAVYNHNHPMPVMGGSVRVFLLNPGVEDVIKALGWQPHHLLRCQQDGLYLCTTRSEDMSSGTQYETSAVQTLSWAVKWLTALELVMTGDLSREKFDNPVGV